VIETGRRTDVDRDPGRRGKDCIGLACPGDTRLWVKMHLGDFQFCDREGLSDTIGHHRHKSEDLRVVVPCHGNQIPADCVNSPDKVETKSDGLAFRPEVGFPRGTTVGDRQVPLALKW
jgi:hypothetical protein